MLNLWLIRDITAFSFGLLWYRLWITRDYRLRKRFSDATAHLGHDDLVAGYRINMTIIADYLHNRPRPRGSLKRANAALIMATVLREHIVAHDGLFPAPRYLQSRRELWRMARNWRPTD